MRRRMKVRGKKKEGVLSWEGWGYIVGWATLRAG